MARLNAVASEYVAQAERYGSAPGLACQRYLGLVPGDDVGPLRRELHGGPAAVLPADPRGLHLPPPFLDEGEVKAALTVASNLGVAGQEAEEEVAKPDAGSTDREGRHAAFRSAMEAERRARVESMASYTVFSGELVPVGESGAWQAMPTLVKVKVPGLRDMVPQVQANDLAVIRWPGNVPGVNQAFTVYSWPMEILLAVQRVQPAHELVFLWLLLPNHFPFRANFHISLQSMRFNVHFVPSRVTHVMQHRALCALEALPSAVLDAALDPVLRDDYEQSDRGDESSEEDEERREAQRELREAEGNQSEGGPRRVLLDKLQAAWVRRVLATKPGVAGTNAPPFLLIGPAGSGKTTTVTRLVATLAERPGARVLLCAPSHSAADTLTERLSQAFAKGSEARAHLFRLVARSRPPESMRAQVMPFTLQDPSSGAFRLPTGKELFSKRVVVSTCNDAALLLRAGVTNAMLPQSRAIALDVATTALRSAGMLASVWARDVRDKVDALHFTHLVIDEAAQATEPETAVPLAVVLGGGSKAAGGAVVVLCGDPHQLGPRLLSPAARRAGLGVSLMERLYKLPLYADAPRCVAELRHNYRAHPALLHLPSQLFYGGRLLPAADPTSTTRFEHAVPILRQALASSSEPHAEDAQGDQRAAEWPMLVVGVDGCDKFGENERARLKSWSNDTEARCVASVVDAIARRCGAATADVGVMTTYRAQVALLRRQLRAKDLGGINVGTVEDFQGVEMPIVVLSVVRATSTFLQQDLARSVGVLEQRKRANVAMTRAMALFVVVGSPAMLEQDPDWSLVLKEARARKLFIEFRE